MPFKVEEVVSGVDMKRVHVIYRVEKIKNVGIANMTEEEAKAAVDKVIAELKAQVTTEIIQDLAPTEKVAPEVPVEASPEVEEVHEETVVEEPIKAPGEVKTPVGEKTPGEVTPHE